MSMQDIDDLRRRSDDGAYHCPQCDAPFTRRSNLRRHYAIHIRNMNSKCQSCGIFFASSEELQYHTLQCPKDAWCTPEPNATTLDNHHNVESELTLPQAASTSTSPDYFSLVSTFPPATTQEEHTDDFLSSFFSVSVPTTPLSFTPADSRTSTPLETPDWGMTPLPPTTGEMMGGDVQRRQPWPNRNKNIGPRRRGSKEKPVYTRRQVEDMLDIISRTFEERMEEIVRRSNHQHLREPEPLAEENIPLGVCDLSGFTQLYSLGDVIPNPNEL